MQKTSTDSVAVHFTISLFFITLHNYITTSKKTKQNKKIQNKQKTTNPKISNPAFQKLSSWGWICYMPSLQTKYPGFLEVCYHEHDIYLKSPRAVYFHDCRWNPTPGHDQILYVSSCWSWGFSAFKSIRASVRMVLPACFHSLMSGLLWPWA